MSDSSVKQTQNLRDSDRRRRFRSFGDLSFRGFKEPHQKSWHPSTVKWFSLFSIGILAHFWAFLIGRGFVGLQLGLTVVLGVSATIVVSILYVENVHVINKQWSRIHRYMNAIIFVGLAVISVSVGWFAGTSAMKFIEIVMSGSMSP